MNFSFNLDGLAAFEKSLKDMEKDFKRNAQAGMVEYSTLAEEGSKSLAPRDSGDLETSIQSQPVAWKGDVIEGSVGSNLSYALRRHEAPERLEERDKYDNGIREADYYKDGKGRRTRQKATWRGQMPGRKYIERAVVATEEEFEQIMAEALEKTLGGN
ncbi:HK97 gp10 family phage protein [Planococcus halocryophilus]|uniref:HK97 gp10 family phage protein n=1 Tax=Planococcus halocryophilus TaxID=1215089 RepID=UPI000592EF17|nr:HK97 gp10 family phage protein [Planococcus halocryophilus]